MRTRAHQLSIASIALALAAALAAAALTVDASAHRAAFPGKNGRIVFNDASGYLVLVNPDGSGVVRLTGTWALDDVIGASFSPDGRQIAYSKYGSTDRTSSRSGPTAATNAR
jgi:hypothetical protein